jgi:hypothetical protein
MDVFAITLLIVAVLLVLFVCGGLFETAAENSEWP